MTGRVWWATVRAFVGFFLPFAALAAFACALVAAYTQTTEVAAVVVDHSASTGNPDAPSYTLEVRTPSGRVYDLNGTDSDLGLMDGQVVLDISTRNGQVERVRTDTASADNTRSVGFEWRHGPVGWLVVPACISLPWMMLVLMFDNERRRLGYWMPGVVLTALAAVAVVSPFFLF